MNEGGIDKLMQGYARIYIIFHDTQVAAGSSMLSWLKKTSLQANKKQFA